MFRTLTAFVLGAILVAFVGTPAFAEDKQEKLEGKITCAKCDLSLTDKCATVIKVGDKVYYFDKDSDKKYHKEICTEPKDGTVVGKVTKDGDKLMITPTKVEFKK
jgi:Family of unknown function (DUF6370)